MPAPRRWIRRAGYAVVVLAALALGGAWLLGREVALQWLVNEAARRSDGRLTVVNPRGSLYGKVQADELRFRDKDTDVELRGVAFAWTPSQLLNRHLSVDLFQADELRIVASKSDKPPEIPKSLAPPLSIDVGRAEVKRIVLVKEGKAQELGALSLAASGDPQEWRLRDAAWASPWGTLGLRLDLGARAPFALRGQATVAMRAENHPVALDADLGGQLARVDLAFRGKSEAIDAAGKAQIAPFEKIFLKAIDLRAKGVDPARFSKGAPKADLALDVTGSGTAADGIAGTVAARNAAPGTVDAKRLPLHALTARFDASPERTLLSQLALDLGDAGKFKGDGEWRGGQLKLTLQTGGLNLRGLQSTLKPTRLAGDLVVATRERTQSLKVNLVQDRYRIRLDAALDPSRVTVKSAELNFAGSEVAAEGELLLAAPRRFQASGQLKRFDPAAFGDYPRGQINAEVQASGALLPQWQALAEFRLQDSRLYGAPLGGGGRLSANPKGVRDADLILTLAANRLALKGAYGEPDDRLRFDLDARQLAVLGRDFGGVLTASGTVWGTPQLPSIDLKAQGDNLHFRDQRLAHLDAAAKLEGGLDGPLSATAALQNLRSGDFVVQNASLAANGTRRRHQATVAARNPQFDLDAALAGGFDAESNWSGALEKLVNRGRYAFRLEAPATLAVGKAGIALRRASLKLPDGRVVVDHFEKIGSRIDTRGRATAIPLSYLVAFAKPDAPLRSTLTLGADWDLAAEGAVNGSARVWREGGDVTLLTEPALTLGLQEAQVRAEIAGNRVRVTTGVTGERVGTLQGFLDTRLVQRDGAWGLPVGQPLAARVAVAMPSLAWLAGFSGRPGIAFDGTLGASVVADGTVGAPNWRGRVHVEKIALQIPDTGVRVKNGELDAELSEDRMVIERAVLYGAKGSASARGAIGLTGSAASVKLDVEADRFEAISRPDRHVMVSGSGKLGFQNRQLTLTGSLRADEGLVELPKRAGPTLSDDVVVVGKTLPPEKKQKPLLAQVDVNVDLGKAFYLRGKGIDAQIGGDLRIYTVRDKLPAATGSIRVERGTYAAYGQRLTIERGILNFSGPLDNPGLNILALRKDQPVVAGVEVTGTVQNPRARLVSEPPVPDSEKLAWLVLGHGLEGASRTEFNALTAAANTLLARGESATLQAKLARATGLDEIGIGTSSSTNPYGTLGGFGSNRFGAGYGYASPTAGTASSAGTTGTGLENTVVNLGKRISSRLYVGYEQGIKGTANLMKITYTLTPRWSIRTQTGRDNAVDLFYTLSFD